MITQDNAREETAEEKINTWASLKAPQQLSWSSCVKLEGTCTQKNVFFDQHFWKGLVWLITKEKTKEKEIPSAFFLDFLQPSKYDRRGRGGGSWPSFYYVITQTGNNNRRVSEWDWYSISLTCVFLSLEIQGPSLELCLHCEKTSKEIHPGRKGKERKEKKRKEKKRKRNWKFILLTWENAKVHTERHCIK